MNEFDPTVLEPLLRRLHLATVRRIYPEMIRQAEQDSWPYGVLLERLFANEVANRADTRVRRLLHKAKFPFLATIETFDFSLRADLKRQLLGRFLGPELVSENRSLILEGPSGTGKTHLCIAIAYKAIQNGFTARFTTATNLVNELTAAVSQKRLEELLTEYLDPHVLVCDEVGYLGYAPGVADLLFQIVDQRYQKGRPILFTTNKALKLWGKVLHDRELAEAIIDRTLHHGEHIRLKGPSYRTRGKNLDLGEEVGG